MKHTIFSFLLMAVLAGCATNAVAPSNMYTCTDKTSKTTIKYTKEDVFYTWLKQVMELSP